MKIHYLGTAAAEGWPALFCDCPNCRRAREAGGKNLRTRPQALIDGQLLMDLGPDTYYHAMAYNLRLWELEAVLVTHSHTDHYYSSETLLKALPYAYDGDKSPLQIYGNTKVEQMFHHTRDVEDDSVNFGDCVKFHTIAPLEVFDTPTYHVQALPAAHDRAEPCVIYAITHRAEGKRLLYANDTAVFPQPTFDALAGQRFDLISLDCTMGGGESGTTHMSLNDCIAVRQRLLELGCADDKTVFVITHFSHNGGLLHHQLEERAAAYNILVAYDGLELAF